MLFVPDAIIGGHFRLVRRLGEGGMGQVWLAIDEHLRRKVAIKRVSASGIDALTHEALRQRLIKEARNAVRIKHPDAVSVFGTIEEGGDVFIVMEYLKHPNLATYVAENGPMSVSALTPAALQLFETVRAIHARGVLHRDFKPGNLLVVSRVERFIVLDFGIARSANDTKTSAQGAMGTVQFMAPEHLATGVASELTDAWSVAMTLYWALTEELPARWDMITPLPSNTPLEKAIMGMLIVDPNKRWTLKRAIDYLHNASRMSMQVTQPAPARQRSRRPVSARQRRDRRNRLIAACVALSVAAVAGVVISINASGSGDDKPKALPTVRHSQSPSPSPSETSASPSSTESTPVPLQTGGTFTDDDVTIDLLDGWTVRRDLAGDGLYIDDPSTSRVYLVKKYGKRDLDAVAEEVAAHTGMGGAEPSYDPWPGTAEVSWEAIGSCAGLVVHALSGTLCAYHHLTRIESQNGKAFSVDVGADDGLADADLLRPGLVDFMDRVTLSP
ncbi:serine/threonine-protein kinase [Streptomyces sp. bgisy154]|uniref:serine/threonine-protein kinase n=1 Tax=Streptomyces sp. bgisy154 TaxID=3413794 RepID=UPI003D7053BC